MEMQVGEECNKKSAEFIRIIDEVFASSTGWLMH